MKRFLKYVLWAFLLFFAFMIGAASERTSKKDTSVASISCETGTAATPPPAATVAATTVVSPGSEPETSAHATHQMPPNERALIQAVERARARYASGANDMQKGAARPKRAKEICAALKSSSVKDWIGHIETLSTNSDGKGVLSIKLADDVYVKTWNNAISDIGAETLIEPDSALFQNASSLKSGQPVSFSGSFVRSKEDCLREVSLTLQGSIESPAFIMRFSDISGL